jgi:ParB family chromosome partitioning protein
MTQPRKGLGRGLSALIPSNDMDFLSQVARGEFTILADVEPEKVVSSSHGAAKKLTAKRQATSEEVAQSQRSAKTIGRKGHSTANEQVQSQNKEDFGEFTGLPSQGIADKSILPQGQKLTDAQTHDDVATFEDEGFGKSSIQWLEPERIVANPYQPRRHFDREELQSLVDSIKEHGILQPVIVRPISASTGGNSTVQYQLVAGERRWRAAREASLAKIPAIVREVSDQQALELAVIENVQRHDITPLDAALAYRRLADEFSLSQEKIAVRVGKSRSAIANTLRLLDLPEEIQQALNDGALSEGHGRAILLAEGEGSRRAAFRRILRDKLSVREAEELARTLSKKQQDGADALSSMPITNTDSQDIAVDLRQIVDELQKLLGSRVALKHRRRGGQIVINYTSDDEMNRILEVLRRVEEK